MIEIVRFLLGIVPTVLVCAAIVFAGRRLSKAIESTHLEQARFRELEKRLLDVEDALGAVTESNAQLRATTGFLSRLLDSKER